MPTTSSDTSEKRQQQKSRGRQKIPISHIIDKSKRHVTFSKRRTGLFKKAAELSTLTGCSIAILTFTGVGKAFSFGSPDVDAVIRRYLSELQSTEGKNNNVSDAASQYLYDHGEDNSSSWTNNYNEDYQDLVMKQVVKREEEKHMRDGLIVTENSGDRGCGDDSMYGGNGGDDNMYVSNGGDDGEMTESLFWWEKAVDENLGLDELEQYMECLEQLKTNVAMKADQLALMNTYYYDEVADLFLPVLIDDNLGFLAQDCTS